MRVLLITICLSVFSMCLHAQQLVGVEEEIGGNNGRQPLDRYTKTNISYGDNQKISYSLILAWDVFSGTWMDRDSMYFTYDDTLLIDKVWTVRDYHRKQWQDNVRYGHTYNADRLLESVVTSNELSGEWINNRKTTFTYNARGFKDTVITSEWHFARQWWEDIAKDLYTYNDAGVLVKEVMQTIDDKTKGWADAIITTYTLNADGKCIESVTVLNVENNYIKRDREQFTYDKGNLIKKFVEEWDVKNNRWTPLDEITYTYNSSGKVQQEIKRNCDFGDTEWRTTSRKTYRYE